MNTLSALFDRLTAGRLMGRAAVAGRRDGGEYRLRTIPNEDIHLYIKRVDNTGVIGVVDRQDQLASIGVTLGTVLGAAMIIGLLLPGGYNLAAQRKMNQLQTQREQLVNEMRKVRIEEGQMYSAEKLKEWDGGRFVEPAATAVIYAPPANGAAVAALERH
jgi:hypothetical protein